jgi:hypothetical protein
MIDENKLITIDENNLMKEYIKLHKEYIKIYKEYIKIVKEYEKLIDIHKKTTSAYEIVIQENNISL